MAVRLNSIETDALGVAWSPTGDTILQFDIPNGVTVQVLGKVEAGADWSVIAEVGYKDDSFLHVDKIPSLNVKIKGSTTEAVRVWSDI